MFLISLITDSPLQKHLKCCQFNIVYTVHWVYSSDLIYKTQGYYKLTNYTVSLSTPLQDNIIVFISHSVKAGLTMGQRATTAWGSISRFSRVSWFVLIRLENIFRNM